MCITEQNPQVYFFNSHGLSSQEISNTERRTVNCWLTCGTYKYIFSFLPLTDLTASRGHLVRCNHVTKFWQVVWEWRWWAMSFNRKACSSLPVFFFLQVMDTVVDACLQSQHLGGRGKRWRVPGQPHLSIEFEASLHYIIPCFKQILNIQQHTAQYCFCFLVRGPCGYSTAVTLNSCFPISSQFIDYLSRLLTICDFSSLHPLFPNLVWFGFFFLTGLLWLL